MTFKIADRVYLLNWRAKLLSIVEFVTSLSVANNSAKTTCGLSKLIIYKTVDCRILWISKPSIVEFYYFHICRLLIIQTKNCWLLKPMYFKHNDSRLSNLWPSKLLIFSILNQIDHWLSNRWWNNLFLKCLKSQLLFMIFEDLTYL